MPRVKLTQDAIKALTSDNPRGDRYTDTDLRGFGVTVYADGRKTFYVRYGPRNRRRFVTIGDHGVLKAADAREAARKILAAHQLQTVDVAREMRRERSVPTFREWCEMYMIERREQKKSAHREAKYLDDACAHFGGKALDEITTQDIKEVRKVIRKRGTAVGNRWLVAMRSCFRAAEADEYIDRNPARFVALDRETPRQRRTLTDAELARLVQEIDGDSDPCVRAALLLMIGTGFRKSEVLKAKWTDIDIEAGIWRLSDPKSGKPETVPLATEVVDLLKATPRMVGSPWVIPSLSNPKKPRSNIERRWRAIRKRARLEYLWIHDLRGVFADRIAREAGLSVASSLLRHANIGVTAARYTTPNEEQQRDALKKVVGGVIPFPKTDKRGK